jgi:hypothetical protein
MKDHRSPEELPNGFKHLDQWYSKFLQQFPQVARNVFIMMPFTTPRTDQIYKTIVRAIEHYGLIPLRADLKTFVPVLWWNIQTYMVGSSYGIAIYEPEGDIPFNPNVSIEAGFMLALDHQVLLLANQKLDRLPVDFSGHVYRRFDEDDVENSVYRAVSDWITRDISYVNYGNKKLIVFVSLGGTCRCVMAKAILEDRLHPIQTHCYCCCRGSGRCRAAPHQDQRFRGQCVGRNQMLQVDRKPPAPKTVPVPAG